MLTEWQALLTIIVSVVSKVGVACEFIDEKTD